MRNPMSYCKFCEEYEDSIEVSMEEEETFDETAIKLYDAYVDSFIDLIN